MDYSPCLDNGMRAELRKRFQEGTTLRALSEEYKINLGTLQNWSSQGKWRQSKGIKNAVTNIKEALEVLDEALKLNVNVTVNVALLDYMPYQEIGDRLLEEQEEGAA